MKNQNCQKLSRLLAAPLFIGLLTSCQTTPASSQGEDIPLPQLNPPPEQLPMWSESPLDTIGNVAGFLPRQTAKLIGLGKPKDSNKPEIPKRKSEKPKPAASPLPTPYPSPATSSISKPSRPKPKPSPKPKPKPKATPRAKTSPAATPAVMPPVPAVSDSNNARNDIIRGKTIQENPLGPRQPIELY